MILAGCDTETYYETIDNITYKGLKSIQLVTEKEEKYFIANDYTESDDKIRCEICKQFIDYLMDSDDNIKIAFFNMTFDLSQFLKYLVTQSDLKVVNDMSFNLKKGQLSFLETDLKAYSVTFRTYKNKLIKMVDLANFAVAASLNDVSKAWLNDEKVSLESKIFPKTKPTEIEKEYAMQDARLTLKLYQKFIEETVIESHTYTIAGRTIAHFKEFCKSEYNITMDKLLFLTEDKQIIEEQKLLFEQELRPGVRGGICQAWQKGIFDHVTHIDARSMYPTQCVRNLYPCGSLLENPPDFGRYTEILYPSGWFTLKKGKIPCVQWTSKGNCERYAFDKVYNPGDYVKDFFLDGSFPIWKEEFQIIQCQYNTINLTIDKRWFIEMRDNVVLKDYVNRLYKGKREETGAKRLYYKYLLNALYGKFLSKPDGVTINYVQNNGIWERTKATTEKNTFYLPLGMYIAMMGRVTLMKAIISLENQDKDFIYCDTDSIVFKGKMPDVVIGKNLGEWGIEQQDVIINVVGQKTYQEKLKDGSVITKCAGMPKNIKDLVEWQGLYDGLKVPCYKPRRDKDTWAINIEKTEFTVSTKAQIFKRTS